MSNILDEICAHKRAYIDACRAKISLDAMEKRAYQPGATCICPKTQSENR